jgi:glycosyltransferase involved in cell wall biosynthesis
MDPEAPDVAMLYQDPHPAHEGFADAVGADLVNYRGREPSVFGDSLAADAYNGLSLPDYDVFIVEGSRPLYTAVIRAFTSDARFVYLCADHGLHALGSGAFEGDSAIKSLIGRFGTPAVRAVGSHAIDGVIAVSEFAAEFTRPIVGSDTPIEIAHPYIQPEVYDTLGTVTPDLGSKTAVTVGRAAPYKGVDLLVDAWPEVRRSHPGAELHVVGGGHPESYDRVEGVERRGYVESLVDAFEPASLFVQPSRMDTFPVSTLEAMRAGLPPLVTEGSGTRSVAREVDEELVVETDTASLAHGVSRQFDNTQATTRLLAARARRIGSRFDAESRKAAFRDAFNRVLEGF